MPDSAPVRSLVVIDPSVSDPAAIVRAQSDHLGQKVIVLDSGMATLESVAAAVSDYKDLQSLHIISHGNAGALQLGRQIIDRHSVEQYRSSWKTIGRSLALGGDLQLYGCNIGRGDEGKSYIAQVARLIGRDVAASSNQTGSARLGADWQLEQATGSIETASLAVPDWNAVLSQNNTAAWTIGTNTASNTVTVGSDTVTATVSFSAHSTATTTTAPITNETLNSIAVFSPAVQSTPSLGVQYNWDTTPEGGTTLASTDGGTAVMTITFSQAVKDPILHLDRIGGSDGTNQNSSVYTLQTGGVTLTRLSGTAHFSVSGSTITNNLSGTAIGSGYTAESSTTTNLGTAGGSVRLNGTFTTVSFLMAPATGTTEGGGGDAIELKLTYDPTPVAQPDSINGYVNTTLSANLYNNNGSGADSDFNSDTLTLTQINGASYTVGTPIVLANGSLTITNATTGAVNFAPTSGFSGTQTFTYTITDANGGVSTTTATITILRTTLTLTKTSLGTVGGFTFTGNNGWSSQTITTITSGVPVSGVAQTLTTPATATTITETIPSGYAVTAISCSGLGSGTATPNLAAGSVTLNAAATAAGNVISCSFTNTKLPTLRLAKTSLGAVGGFTFTGNNGWASQTITTVTSGVVANGVTQTLTAANTATTITEAIPSGYAVTDISCAGLGSGTATPNLAAGSVAFNALATAPGNTITCTYTNTKLPTLQLRKISNGGVGAFNFSGNNGFGSDAITTVTQGTPVNGTVKTLTTASTATTITETIPPTYFVSSISCSGLAGGSATPTLATGAVVLDAAATAPGNVIVCTYTNTVEAPALTVVKSANTAGPVSAGNIITYTFHVTNSGNRPMSAVQVAESFNGTGVAPVVANETLLTDAAPAGDSTDATPNNGTWTALGPGDVIRFTATYTVTQSDIDSLQ